MPPYEHTSTRSGSGTRSSPPIAPICIKVRTAADISAPARRQGRRHLRLPERRAIGDDLGRVDDVRPAGRPRHPADLQPGQPPRRRLHGAGNRGLTPFGREVVERLNAQRHHGRPVAQRRTDLPGRHRSSPGSRSRSTTPAAAPWPTCRATRPTRNCGWWPRRGGFVGIYFMPFLNLSGHARAADVVAHIDHAVNVCGEDHVGIGTDGSVTAIDDLDAYRATLAEHVALRQAAGIGAAGERADTLPVRRRPARRRPVLRADPPARAARLPPGPDREDPRHQLRGLRPAYLGGVARCSAASGGGQPLACDRGGRHDVERVHSGRRRRRRHRDADNVVGLREPARGQAVPPVRQPGIGVASAVSDI